MRIAYLNPVGTLGGAERCLLTVLKAVREAEPDAELHLIASADGPLLGEAEALGVRARALPMPAAMARMGDSGLRGRGLLSRSAGLVRQTLAAAPRLPRYVRQLRQALAAIGPDLIHSNGIKTHLLARLAAPAGTPVVWHVHDFLSQRPVMARVLRWAARRTAGAIAVSEAVRRDARAVLPTLPATLVYNAVDVDHFRPGPGDGPLLDQLAGLPLAARPHPLRVGLVATYARWKGHDIFLDAAARIQRERPGQARFYVIGGPVYATRGSQCSEEELRSRAADLGLSGAVGFVGFQRDVAGVYRALDVVVHASTRPEPFGLTIAEAMACGRAVVAVKAGGAAELFTDGHDAAGVPPNDAGALANAVRGLLDDPPRRCRLAEGARRTAVAQFSSGRLGRQLLKCYGRFASMAISGRPRE
jgi:glycosyltransferase involved in cell wall biosynthesis